MIEIRRFSGQTGVGQLRRRRACAACSWRHCRFTRGARITAAAAPRQPRLAERDGSKSSGPASSSTVASHDPSTNGRAGSSGGSGGSTSGDGTASQPTAGADSLGGYVALISVTLLWGSYTPALRFLFAADDAVTPAQLTAARAVVSAAALLAGTGAAALWAAVARRSTPHLQQQQQGADTGRSSSSSSSNSQVDSTSAAPVGGAPLLSTLLAGLELGAWNFAGTAAQATGLELTTATKAAFLAQVTGALTPALARALGQRVPAGSWVACAAALLGSCLITADSMAGSPRAPAAAEQQQTTTEVVAASLGSTGSGSASSLCVELAAGGPAPALSDAPTAAEGVAAQLPACAAAPGVQDGAAVAPAIGSLGGSSIGGGDTGDGSSSSVGSSVEGTAATQQQQEQERRVKPPPGPESGDGYVLLACLFYALATVRLSALAPRHDAGALTTAKAVTLAAASIAWLTLSGDGGSIGPAGAMSSGAAAVAAGDSSSSGGLLGWLLPPPLAGGVQLGVLVYSALGPGALAAYLQTRGQATVSATQAQVVFALTPIWAALLALGLDGEEMGLLAWAGAGVILAATAGVALAPGGAEDGAAAESAPARR